MDILLPFLSKRRCRFSTRTLADPVKDRDRLHRRLFPTPAPLSLSFRWTYIGPCLTPRNNHDPVLDQTPLRQDLRMTPSDGSRP